MKNDKQLPFLNRSMLEFQHGTVFQIEVLHKATKSTILAVEGFTKEGPFRFRINTTSDGAAAINVFNVPDIPIMVSVRSFLVGMQRGEVFVNLFLRINGDRRGTLASGYVNDLQSVSWPVNDEISSQDGRGLIRSVLGTDPDVQVEISEDVPANVSWKLKAIQFVFITDSNVSTRSVRLRIKDGTNILFIIPASETQIASEVKVYNFVEVGSVQTASSGSHVMGVLPSDLLLPEGFQIQTNTDNLEVGDNFTAPRLVVEQYISPLLQ